MPVLLMILPNGIQVYRSQIKDIFGSSIILAGPHPSVTDVHRKHWSGFHKLQVLFTQAYNLFRDYQPSTSFEMAVEKDHPLPLQCKYQQLLPVSATAIERFQDAKVSCKAGNSCFCSKGEDKPSKFSFCVCCFEPGEEMTEDHSVEMPDVDAKEA